MSRSKKAIKGDPEGNRSCFLVLVIVLLGLGLRLFFFSGVSTSDDLEYSAYSANLGDTTQEGNVLTLSTRLGIIYATAISYSFFGINDASSVIFVLLTSLGMIVLAFLFGDMFGGRKAGYIAAFLMAIFPLEVVYATKLYADIPSAFFMSLGVYFFLYAERKEKHVTWLYAVSGVSMGLGYFIRESAILIVLFFVAYIVIERRWRWSYLFMPLGVFLFICLEFVMLLKITGNPFYRYTVVQDYLFQSLVNYNFYGRLEFPAGLFHYPYIILTQGTLALTYIFVFIALWHCLRYGKKETYPLVYWLIPLLVYLSWGSASFSHYAPFVGKDRYLTIVTIPAITLLALMLSEKDRFVSKTLMPACLLVMVASSITVVAIRQDRHTLDDLKEAVAFLEANELSAYADERSVRAASYILRYEREVPLVKYPQFFEKGRESYVLINKDFIARIEESDAPDFIPKEVHSPPKEWVLVKEIGGMQEGILIYRT